MFFAGAIMPGAGVAVIGAKKSASQLLGMVAVDRFNNLSLLSYKKKKVKKIEIPVTMDYPEKNIKYTKKVSQ